MNALAVATLFVGYLLLYAGLKGGDVARRPWSALR